MSLFAVVRRHSNKKLMTLAIVFGLISGGLSTALLISINEYLFSFDELDRGYLVWVFWGLLPLVAIARFFSSFTLVDLSVRMAYDLQLELSRRILGAPLRGLEKLGTHRLWVALTDDIHSVSDALMTIPMFFINVAVVVGGIAYLGYLSPVLLVVVLVFLLLAAVTYVMPMQAGVRRQDAAREVQDELYGHFRGVTQGVKELKMRAQRRSAFLKDLSHDADTFRGLRVGSMRIFIAAANWGNLLFFILVGLLMFYLPQRSETVDLDVIAGSVMVLLYILTPVQMILDDFPMLTRADVALKKIDRLGISLAKDPEELAVDGRAQKPGWTSLELKDVSHTYHHDSDDSEFQVGPLSLTFQPGELVFLVGGNGSGKTSLAKLIMGLYPPEEGTIFFDGEEITDANRARYRQNFSVVFSDFFLFDSLLGSDDATDLDGQAREHLEKLRLQHKVRIEDGRFSTVELSQGQRKRLALVAAYLEDAPIFLFDEWAADQDPEFKDFFYRVLLPELRARGKLVLVISHDDKYYEGGDRLIRLDYGQLAYDRPAA
ncbi:MAG: cyclic peptide export ABC transporter [Acidobacteriota bacterium]|nr:cyclic peptide export ABC transporter [Acidobacteriota bacterium]